MCRYHLPETRNNSRRFVVSYTHCQVSVARWRRRAAPPRTGTAPESTGELRTGSKIRNYHYQWQTGSTAVQATSPHAFLSLPFPVCLPLVASRTASPVPPPHLPLPSRTQPPPPSRIVMAAGLAFPVASFQLACVSSHPHPGHRICCAIPSSSSRRIVKSSPLRATTVLSRERRGTGRGASVVCAVQGQDTTIQGTRVTCVCGFVRT